MGDKDFGMDDKEFALTEGEGEHRILARAAEARLEAIEQNVADLQKQFADVTDRIEALEHRGVPWHAWEVVDRGRQLSTRRCA